MTDQPATVWLIERADPNNPGHVLADHFLGVEGSYDGVYGSGEFRWFCSAKYGLRFARQKDAAMFIGAFAAMMENLPHRETIGGLRSGDPRAIPVEHAWEDKFA